MGVIEVRDDNIIQEEGEIRQNFQIIQSLRDERVLGKVFVLGFILYGFRFQFKLILVF